MGWANQDSAMGFSEQYDFAHRFLPDFLQAAGKHSINPNSTIFFQAMVSDREQEFLSDLVQLYQARHKVVFSPAIFDDNPAIPDKVFEGKEIYFLGATLIEDLPCIILKMPPPEIATDAICVAVVSTVDQEKLWNGGGDVPTPIYYFTLEATGTGDTMLCEWADGQHLNHGSEPAPNSDAFSDVIDMFLSRIGDIIKDRPSLPSPTQSSQVNHQSR